MHRDSSARHEMREYFALAGLEGRQVMSEVAILPAKAIIRYIENNEGPLVKARLENPQGFFGPLQAHRYR